MAQTKRAAWAGFSAGVGWEALRYVLEAVIHPVKLAEAVLASPWTVVGVILVAGFVAAYWTEILDAAYWCSGLFLPRTYKGYLSRLIRRIRALVLRAKAPTDVREVTNILTAPKAVLVVAEAHEAKMQLLSLFQNDPKTARELSDLALWPDDMLAHMADTFARLLSRIDDAVPAPPRPPRRGPPPRKRPTAPSD